MLNDRIELLNGLIDDSLKQPPVFQAGPYWMKRARAIKKVLVRQGISDFRSKNGDVIGHGYTDTAAHNDPLSNWEAGSILRIGLKRLLKKPLFKRIFLSGFYETIKTVEKKKDIFEKFYLENTVEPFLSKVIKDYGIPNTLVGGCEDYFVCQGQKISKFYIDNIVRIFSYKEKMNFNQVTHYCELGGGFGANTHLMLHFFPNIKKVIYVDIPPMLYVGTQYLKAHYGSAVRDYLDIKESGEVKFSDNNDLEIFCIPPWLFENYKSKIDLFWNACSFQEMTPEIIKKYANSVQKGLSLSASPASCLLFYEVSDLNSTVGSGEIMKCFDNLKFTDVPQLFDASKDGNTIYKLGIPK